MAQAFDSLPASVFVSASLKAGMLAAALVLAGCGVGGFSLAKADVDRSIVTSSIPVDANGGDTDIAADQATIRNAVSSADLEELAGQAIPWANAYTGSRGAITSLAEDRSRSQTCRRFTASRESFDGVALFRGEACSVAPGAWRLQAFEPM